MNLDQNVQLGGWGLLGRGWVLWVSLPACFQDSNSFPLPDFPCALPALELTESGLRLLETMS